MNNRDEVTRLDLAALAHQLRRELADLLAAYRACQREAVAELTRRVERLEGQK
jgi:hypothetical protein